MTLDMSRRLEGGGSTAPAEPGGWHAGPGGPPMVGDDRVRREALDAIRRACSATDEQVLVVIGPEGAGKSTLLRRAAADPQLDAQLLQVSAAEAQWATSGLSYLLTLWPARTDHDLIRRLGSRSEDDAYEVASEMLFALRETGGSHALLIDDLDSMDSVSLTLVAVILRRLRGTGLSVVATTSSLVRGSPLTGLPTITLPPLTGRQALDVARAHADGRYPDRVLEAAAHFGGGNAAGVVEALAGSTFALRDPAAAAWRPPGLGEVSERAVDRRLSGLSPEAVDVLRWMSLARCTPRDLSVLSPGAVDELLDAGDVDAAGGVLSFVDPRQRAVLYWRMAPAERARRHAALARAARPVDVPTSAWHTSFLPEPPAAEDLVEAAHGWVGPGTAAAAADLVERAVVGGQPSDATVGAVLAVAEALCDVGAYEEVARVCRLVVGQGDGLTQLRATLVCVRAGSMVHPDALDAAATKAVQTLPSDPELLAWLLHLVCFYLHEMGRTGRAREWWQQVDRVVDGCTASTLARHARLRECIGIAPNGRRLGPPPSSGTSPHAEEQAHLLIAARGESNRERYTRARDAFAALADLRHLTPLVREAVPLFMLENDCRAGDFDRARESAARVSTLQASREALEVYRAGALAVYWTLSGHPELAGEHVDQVLALPSRLSGSPVEAKVHAALGHGRLDEGDLEEAHRMLMRADRAGDRIEDPLVLRHEGDLVEVLVELGDRGAAQRALARFHARLRRHPSRWGALVLQRSSALVLDDSASVAALRKILATWPAEIDAPYAYERARTEAILARRIEESGNPSGALEHWHGAADAMDRVGHRARARSLRAGHVARTPVTRVRATPPGSLNEREQAVVDRVLAGARNREIARELFVSLRTVESRLTSSYRKLGVRSRAELIAVHLRGRDGGSGGSS